MENIYIVYTINISNIDTADNENYYKAVNDKILGYTDDIEYAESIVDLFSGPLRKENVKLGIMEIEPLRDYIDKTLKPELAKNVNQKE